MTKRPRDVPMLTDECAFGKLIPRKFLSLNGFRRKYLLEAPELHKIIPARSRVTDVLCSEEPSPKQ